MNFRSTLIALPLLSASLLYSNTAFAKDAVVVPLYSPNLDANKIGNITSLITSEVDFSGRYSMVSQADKRPSTLTPKCLKAVSCLKPIATNENVNAMVTGSVTKMGNELEFFIVLYENEKIIRMKRFRIEDSPLSVAANVGSHVQEVVTGKSLVEEDDPMADVPLSNVLEEEEDIFGGSSNEDLLGDFSLDGDDSKAENDRIRAQEAQEAEARRLAEEARRRSEMEEQARRLAMEVEAANKQAQANSVNTTTDDFDFNFAPSTVEIIKEDKTDSNEAFNFTEPEPKVEQKVEKKVEPKVEAPKKEATKSSTSKSSTSSSSNTKSKKSVQSGRIDAAATLGGKVGAGNFQTLNFVTYGGEIGIFLSESVSVNISGEGYATNQPTPVYDEDGEATGEINQDWRILIPVSVGIEYHFEGRTAKPYIGADLQVLPLYAGAGSGAAIGMRGKAGTNLMIADNFGINLNLAMGFWNGQYFQQVPSPAGGFLSVTGLAPQVSIGPVIAF